MRETRIMMGMPITVEVCDLAVTKKEIENVFKYFDSIDKRFSTYKKTSEVSKINRGEISRDDYSDEMREVLQKCDETKSLTDGFFDIKHDGKIDPSGLVKGWAIYNASLLLKKHGFKNFYVDAGGDIEVSGNAANQKKWRVGIRNPFNRYQNVKVIEITDCGVATSGTAIRGNHIYSPKTGSFWESKYISLTVVGPNIYEADRFATAAFVMESNGLLFLQKMGLEGYLIDKEGLATFTPGFEKFVV